MSIRIKLLFLYIGLKGKHSYFTRRVIKTIYIYIYITYKI